ncbi:MAG: peptidoglycan bridge formation glycyltransferase FemA/FemB family protein [Candidatus Saccharimonadales bacterium]
MISMRQCTDKQEWDDYIIDQGGHPLQLWGWGSVKALHGWRVDRVYIEQGDHILGAAQLLIRRLPRPLNALVYVPRGPVTDDEYRERVMEHLADYAKTTYNAVAMTIEPDWVELPALPGWQPSDNTILIPRTLILDLTRTEAELMADMSKKTRQYIRKSAADGVVVRRVKTEFELEQCLALYHETAARAGFPLHPDGYYKDIFREMGEFSPVFAAFSGDQMLAFLWPIISGSTVFELYGGMNDEGQRLRANYTLKWEVIRTMQEWGLERYDMNGLLNDGVSTFKQSFATHEDMLVGTYDKPLSPLYVTWKKGLPLAKKVIRTIKR